MKKLALLAVLLFFCLQAPLRAQEREPLAMRIMLDWTLGGVLMGILVGGAIWMTDPGREGNRLSEQVAGGAAWGAVAGAAFALTVINEAAIPPAFASMPADPLHPARRITSDPIGEEERRKNLLASASAAPRRGRAFLMPLINLRF